MSRRRPMNRKAQHGGDRRFGRSLAETLRAGRGSYYGREELDAWDPEDIAEQQKYQQIQKNINLGFPEDYDGSVGYN